MKVIHQGHTLDVQRTPIDPALLTGVLARHPLQREYRTTRGSQDATHTVCCTHQMFRIGVHTDHMGARRAKWCSRPCVHGVVMIYGTWTSSQLVQTLGAMDTSSITIVQVTAPPKPRYSAAR